MTVANKTYLSAASILAAEDLIVHEEEVPEWPDPATGLPGIVRLMQMSAEESFNFTQKVEQDGNNGMFIMLRYSAVDADGTLLFTDEDIVKLRKKSMKVLNRLQQICLSMNGMRGEDEVTLKKD